MKVGDWLVSQNGSLFRVTSIEKNVVQGDFYSTVSSNFDRIQPDSVTTKQHAERFYFPIDDTSRRNYFKALLK